MSRLGAALRIFAYGSALALFLLAYYDIYILGTLNGMYSVVISTNRYGEHYPELIWNGLALPLVVYFYFKDAGGWVKEAMHGTKKKRRKKPMEGIEN